MAAVAARACDDRERWRRSRWRSTRVRPTGRMSRWSTPTCTSHPARSRRWCPTCPRGGATTSARAGSRAWSPTSTRRGRRSAAIPGARPADGPPASDPELLRAQLLDPWRPAPRRHALHLRRRRHPQPRLGRRHGARGQRLAARRVARGRTAAARIGRRRGPGPGLGGGGDRPRRRPPGVRAGAPAGTDARAAGHPGVLADLRGRRAARPGARRLRGRRERQSRHAGRGAELLPGGVRRAVAGLPGPGRQPRLRGRAGAVPATCRSCSSNRGSPGCRR